MPFTVHTGEPPRPPEMACADPADPATRRISALVWIIPPVLFWAAVAWVVWRVI
jgi:hypothetical protein